MEKINKLFIRYLIRSDIQFLEYFNFSVIRDLSGAKEREHYLWQCGRV